MSGSYGVISTSEPRFSILPSPLPPPSTTTRTRKTQPDPFLGMPITTQSPTLRIVLRKRVGVGSCRPPRVALHDATVAAAVPPIEGISFYELLGIPETGSLLEIKQAYRQLARKYHPDVSPPGRVQEYTQRFIQVQEAYETLSDPRRRASYDTDMARGLHLAFSARRRYQCDEQMEEKIKWKGLWESQLSELNRRSIKKDANGNMSWAARMRRRGNES